MTPLNNRWQWVVATFVIVLSFQPSASATTITVVNEVPGTTEFVVGITGSATTGGDMAGMLVTALFGSGRAVTVPWTATGVDSGQATGEVPDVNDRRLSFLLSQGGDTFTDQWTLTNTSEVGAESALIGFVLDGFPGDTVFDRTFGGAFGTTGSFLGRDFFSDTDLGFDLTLNAIYVGQVAINGSAPVGDLFRFLDVRFSEPIFNTDPALQFFLDTDSIGLPPGQAPEPATLLLLAAGLASVIRRRRA